MARAFAFDQTGGPYSWHVAIKRAEVERDSTAR